MTTGRMAGVPRAVMLDAWWLDGTPPDDAAAARAARRRRDGGRALLLVALIALGDVLVWDVWPGLSLALLCLLICLAGLALAWPGLTPRTRVGIAAGAVLAVLPLVELVQPLSLLIAFVAALMGCAALAGLRHADLMRGAARLVWVGPVQSARDAVRAMRSVGKLGLADTDLRALVMGWALPVLASLVFVLLLVGANPVLDRWLADLGRIDLPAPHPARLWLWGILGLLIWPVLVAHRMRERLRARAPARATVVREGVVNALSVARSLVAFNALFAVQTGMDVLFLYGDAALPDGISPATYAHRGAYPLLVTALLAGLFAVVARPYLRGQPVVRVLMFVWLAQTLALVVASVWRLDLYVDAYGLTRLRMAAYVWMGLVAVGLCIVVVQVWRDLPAAWMMLRSALLGAVALYACAFIDFDGVIAQHNLTRDVAYDPEYLCELGEGVIPAIRRHSGLSVAEFCATSFYEPDLFVPQDWREWGFRNWRLRRSLAAMTPRIAP